MTYGPEPDPQESHERAPIWLITFGDVVALMLTFFVMLFATSKIPSEKWETVVGTMSENFRFSQAGLAPNPLSDSSVVTVTLDSALPTEYLAGVFRDHVAEDNLLKDAIIRRQDGRVVISLYGDAMFAPGSALPSDKARAAVARIGGVLETVGNQVEIRGHSGPGPAEGADYDSNWALSFARAAAVARALRASGYQRKLVVLGLGDSRFSHLDPDLPLARRRALARRVDVIVYATAEEP